MAESVDVTYTRIRYGASVAAQREVAPGVIVDVDPLDRVVGIETIDDISPVEALWAVVRAARVPVEVQPTPGGDGGRKAPHVCPSCDHPDSPDITGPLVDFEELPPDTAAGTPLVTACVVDEDADTTAEPGTTAGTVLGEDARAALSDALVQGVPGLYSEWDDGADVGKVLAAISPVVSSLVAAAEKRGAEKAAEAIEAARPQFEATAEYRLDRPEEDWFVLGLDKSAEIARWAVR